MKTVLAALVLGTALHIHAAETDNFSTCAMGFIDAGNLINERSQTYLEEALNHLNTQGGCDLSEKSEVALYEEMAKYFSNHKTGALVRSLLYTDEFPKIVTPLRESIYKEWSIHEGYLLGGKNAANSPLAISPVVQVAGVKVGIDKFEHMFGMGFKYFEGHYLKDKNLKSILKNGIFREKTALGGNILATGVFSYADLAANFNGMRFWNHVLQKRDDVLGKDYNIGPYVVCSEGKWKVNPERPLDFSNYVDHSMNESVNCSKFATKSGLKKFQDSMVRLHFVGKGDEAACPVVAQELEEVIKKYDVPMPGDENGPNIGHWIINAEGTGKVSYLNMF